MKFFVPSRIQPSPSRRAVVRSDFAEAFLPDEARTVRRMEPADFSEFMRERQQALRVEIGRVASGELVTRPRNDDCGFCDLRPVCRIGTFGVGGASGDE